MARSPAETQDPLGAGIQQLSQLPTAVVVVEAPSGTILLSSRTGAELMERLGMTAGALVAPREDSPLSRCLATGEEIVDEELVHDTHDGQRVHLRCDCWPIHDADERFIAAVATIRDVTEDKRAEHDAHRRDETILESITDDFVAFDRSWRLTYLNQRALTRFEQETGRIVAREDLIGQSCWEVFPRLVGSTLYEELHRALHEHRTVVFEVSSPRSGGVLEVHAYPSEDGLSIYSRDITDRKRAAEELERRARQQAGVAELGLRALGSDRLQRLLDEAVVLVARTLDVELVKVVELLPGGDDVLVRSGIGWRGGVVGNETEGAGLDSQAGFSLRWGEPVVVEDLATEQRFAVSAVVHEHEAVSAATVVIAGREAPFGALEALSTHRRSFSGDDVNFLQAVANVLATAVERNDAERRLRDAREAERRRIARDLHDEALRDLTHALVEAQHARARDPAGSEPLARLVPVLQRVGQQLRGAIYDLRLVAEEQRPFPELLESLVKLHRTMAPDCRIDLDVREGAPGGALGQKGTELVRMLGEALTNARRHSGAESIRVGVWGSENKLWAEVADDGHGFDPERRATGAGGAGIQGMRERAGLLDGVLTIRSGETGTKVRLEIPLGDGRDERPAEAVRVLLVEDHAAVREAIAFAFERAANFEVVGQAASLAEARRMLEEVDVAVVDLGLPDGYGGDLITELREVNPQAQALVLSASLDRAQLARAVERGAAGVIDKTAHLEDVVDSVRRLRAGEPLMPLPEVVELLRFAGRQREQERDERRAIGRLTNREREVLQALAEGLDSHGVAARLHITVRTERNHVASILAKLGVHSRLQALVFALRHGLIEVR